VLAGLREIADRYEAVVLDQWGVLHGGAAPYPGVVDCLRALAARGTPMAVLSNSGKRAASNRQRLAELGVPVELFAAIVTSGEATWRAVADDTLPFPARGRRALLLSRGGDREIVEGLDVGLADGPADADFVLLAGTDMPGRPMADYLALLRDAAGRGLPLVCANPDVTGVSPDGLIAAPGTLALRYEEMGGRVQRVGKPDPLIYEVCLNALGRPRPEGVLAIGDSLSHDVAGGRRSGLATVLVAGGIHGPALAAAADAGDGRPPLARLIEEFGERPDFVLPALRW
jgi:HAD superfamily hydrolase (TIGR01459 family)